MPELPEVETIARELRLRLIGQRLAGIRVSRRRLRRKWSASWVPMITGLGIETVRRRGKWIILDLNGHRHLLFHLGMTGQLRLEPADAPPARHTHWIGQLDRGGQQLRFRDIRRFGSVTFFPDNRALEQFFEKTRLGPEAFDLDADYWALCLMRTRRCLKAVLMDQRVVAGVGNIYADESLFDARLHPTQPGHETTPSEAKRLRRSMVRVLNRAIGRRGSSIRNYVSASGLQGEYQKEFRVYGQTGKPCPRCRTPIERIRLGGRSTHFCPGCQRSLQPKVPAFCAS